MLKISRILELDIHVWRPLENDFLDEDSDDSWGSRVTDEEMNEENYRAF